jgi:hypothetical protein
MAAVTQRPPWLKVRLPVGPTYERVREVVRRYRLHTVCQSALCPNIGPRAVLVVESVVAIVLADHAIRAGFIPPVLKAPSPERDA